MRMKLFAFLIVAMVAGCASHSKTHPSLTPVSGPVVFIDGAVVHFHGMYPWHEGMTFRDLLKAAGGLSIYGDNAGIHVTHADGTRNGYRYPRIVSGETKDPVLLRGDKVHLSQPIF